jgi:hypothetical protein
MATVNKGQKGKGGKPIAGASASEVAFAKNAEAVAAFTANPRIFAVFTVTEDVGVSKKSPRPEYILKGVFEGKEGAVSVFVPSAFITKNGKLALREMGMVGRRLAVCQKTTATERTQLSGGCMAKGTVMETDYIVAAVLHREPIGTDPLE